MFFSPICWTLAKREERTPANLGNYSTTVLQNLNSNVKFLLEKIFVLKPGPDYNQRSLV